MKGESEEPVVRELQIIHRDGHLIWVEIKSGVINESNGNPRQVISVVRDISERKAIELELQEREEGYRLITTSAQHSIVTTDDQWRITLVNPATTKVFGYEPQELIGSRLTTILPEFTEACLADRASAEEGVSLTGRHRTGTPIPLELSFAEHNLRGRKHFTAIIRDVTLRTKVEDERMQLQQQLMASQKMESIGQLTGGIAHDFNNLLVAIIGYAELGLKAEATRGTLNGYLREIKRAGQRAADMTQKLLAFSRRQIIEPGVVNVNDLIHGIDLMIKRLLPENIDVRLTFTDENLNVMADKGQLEQVLVNLAVNARDAMPHGGRLHISAERVIVDDALTRANPGARKGDYVLIRVSDTGFGISDEVQKKMFEPFFTTKPEGAGTGLGLAVVFGIIKQHGGFIDVQSEMAQGASIKIYIPATSAREKPSTAKTGADAPVKGGSETLLIVEDNKQVRELARLILTGA
ncbi:MAG: PAS domain S-box protein, partial [Pseudomonadales bacterium]|nr:PAS domain S-box protein [Pseudomonadales bacterium]